MVGGGGGETRKKQDLSVLCLTHHKTKASLCDSFLADLLDDSFVTILLT